jgi:hypothetical protein
MFVGERSLLFDEPRACDVVVRGRVRVGGGVRDRVRVS